MRVFSVLFDRPGEDRWLSHPFPRLRDAEAHAREHNTDCKRTIIDWDMPHAEKLSTYAALLNGGKT